MTTVWRKKAYDMFGFAPGMYSYAHGKVALFADLREMAIRAAAEHDHELLDRIFEYALWADQQRQETLRSAADIEFFMPIFRHSDLAGEAMARIPAATALQKQSLLNQA